VFLIRRRQVARQPGAVTPQPFIYYSLMDAGSLHRPLPGLRASGSQWVPGCHAPCSSSSFVTAATVAIASLRSLRPSLRFISPRSYLTICVSAWQAVIAKHKAISHGLLTCTFASQRYNTHWVPFHFASSSIHFRHALSTRCQLFCSPAFPTSAALSLRMLIAHVVPPFAKHR
jgi:hypothetical protein